MLSHRMPHRMEIRYYL
ncbi:unnamed protein product, partial [Vitis vinifera]|uniref:Uncharacterized protein n=1 Tax=Vitis vinifera TaxID=29760 RepID=D7U5V2_VITVI